MNFVKVKLPSVGFTNGHQWSMSLISRQTKDKVNSSNIQQRSIFMQSDPRFEILLLINDGTTHDY